MMIGPGNNHTSLKALLDVSEKWKYIIGDYIEVNVSNARQDFSFQDMERFKIVKLNLDKATKY
jgi:hypothetical protein